MSGPEGSVLSGSRELRVLIADDVQETRRSTRLMMTLVPNTRVVAIAQNGREAIEMAQEHHPDVAILDINMPEMDGLTAIRAMLKQQPHMICIVISAEKQEQTYQEAMDAGAFTYLVKPFTAEEFLAAMEKARQRLQTQPYPRVQTAPLSTASLERLAEIYAKSRRMDKEAVAIYEALVSRPGCAPKWYITLAMAYVLRQDWRKLKALASYLESLKH